MSFFDEQPDGDIHGECALEIQRQQETIEALAGQNRLLRDALEDTHLCNPCDYGAQLKAYDKAIEALALPDLSTSILNQRDARTLRGLLSGSLAMPK